MSININNYETYFLLYLDNELDIQARQELEEFLDQHPKYREELSLLGGVKLNPAPTPNTFQSSLLKLPSGLSAEEAMLLEADGEISAQQLAELDALSNDFAQLADDRRVMSLLKLDKDDVLTFSERASLYRHEPRVIPFGFWKRAIAAVLIGAGLFFGFNQINKPVDTGLAVRNPEQTSGAMQEKKAGVSSPVVAESNGELNNSVVNKKSVTQPKEDNITMIAGNSNKPQKTNDVRNVQPASSSEVESLNPVLENFNNLERNNHAYTTVSQEKKMELNINPPNEVKFDVERLTASRALDEDLTVQKNGYAAAAGVSEDNSSIGHVFVVDEEKVNKSKFGGFVRKMKRTIEKKTNINLPGEFTVAGFEIAIK